MSSTKSSQNAAQSYYYSGPSYYLNDAYAASTPVFPEMDKNYLPPPFLAHHPSPLHPPAPYPTALRSKPTKKAKCVAPCFAILFVIFFMLFLGILIAWAILSDGFRNVDTRSQKNWTAQDSIVSPSNSAFLGNPPTNLDKERTKSTELPAIVISKSKTDFRKPEPLKPTEKKNVCTSEECVQVASAMLKNQDRSVDPCEDFYEFACGDYKDHTVLTDDRRRVNVLSEMGIQLKRQLKSLLEEPRQRSDPKSARMAKTFYESCMNKEQINEMGAGPLLRLGERFGQWPVLVEKWDQAAYKWEVQAGNLRRYAGVEAIVSVFIYVDMEDSNTRLITVDQPGLGLGSREYYMKGKDSETLQAYLDYMTNTAVVFGADPDQARKQMEQVLDLEILIANISVPESDRRDHSKLFNPMSLQELKAEVSFVDWDTFLRATFSNTPITLSDDEKVNIIGLPYLKSLGDVLRRPSQRTIANYLMWNLYSSYTNYLPKKYQKPYQEFRVVLSGVTEDEPDWTECVRMTQGFLKWPVSYMYIQEYFTSHAKQEMEEIVGNLGDVMQGDLSNNGWMDAETKQEALLKLRQMGRKIGFPDYINNQSRILEGFDQLTLFNNSYFANVVRITQKKTRLALGKLQEEVDKAEWDAPPAVVNAFYSFSKNEIVFPAGILQFPVFNLGAPRYVNYARIGMVIGHEITHGYDDQGRQYDGNGNIKAWWNPQTLEHFTEKAQCFVRQYSNITEPVTKKKLNGKLTVGENIADNGGIRIAHDAYMLWKGRSGKGEEAGLAGFRNMTNEQLFFLSFANGWCEIVRPEAIDFYLTLDPHSLAKYRVNVPLQNYPAFSKAFGCKTGAAMNPSKKCRVW